VLGSAAAIRAYWKNAGARFYVAPFHAYQTPLRYSVLSALPCSLWRLLLFASTSISRLWLPASNA
jgi:hypothetical protein